jgi:hypothetical protein
LSRKFEESQRSKKIERHDGASALKQQWKGQVVQQRSNQKLYLRKEQDEFVFTGNENPGVVIEKKLKER